MIDDYLGYLGESGRVGKVIKKIYMFLYNSEGTLKITELIPNYSFAENVILRMPTYMSTYHSKEAKPKLQQFLNEITTISQNHTEYMKYLSGTRNTKNDDVFHIIKLRKAFLEDINNYIKKNYPQILLIQEVENEQ